MKHLLRFWRSLLGERADEPIGFSTREQFNDPELFELRMARAAQRRAMDQAWERSRREKAVVIQIHRIRP
jgi:hypothetical protein